MLRLPCYHSVAKCACMGPGPYANAESVYCKAADRIPGPGIVVCIIFCIFILLLHQPNQQLLITIHQYSMYYGLLKG
jgi:hypothetical protein